MPVFLAGQVSGNVFRDYNSSGSRDSNLLLTEPFLSGVTVKAYDGSGAQVGSTATTDANGAYSIAVANGTPVRVEFSGFPAGLFAGNQGEESGTTVQFATAPNSNLNLGLTSLSDYDQYGLHIFTGCYANGDPIVSGSESGLLPAIVGVNYYGKIKKPSALGNQVGSTWGIAYAIGKKQLYTAAVVRRHVGFGPDGIGAIYKSDPYNPATTTGLFYDFGALVGSVSPRDLVGTLASPSYDADAFAKVGKAGIGDIDISTDENTLYVVNLADRKLYKIAIDVNGAASGSAVEIADAPWLSAPPCTDGTARPWALKVYDSGSGDKIYVGGICDASGGTPTVANLNAWVYEYDVTTATWNPTPRLSFSLDFLRQNPGGNNSYGTTFKWKPWTDSYTTMTGAYNSTTQVGGYSEITGAGGGNYAQPILSDIEIDDNGDMILGFMDRGGIQFGASNYTPVSPNTTLVSYVSAGDLLRAGKNADGTFTIENNGITNGVGGARTTSMPNPLTINGYTVNDGGPGGREFYWGEYYIGAAGSNIHHWESSFGGLAFIPGKNEILLSALDPDNAVNSGGILWLDNTNGSHVDGVNLYTSTTGSGFFAKAIGISDLEPVPGPPLNEIGNRIFADGDQDGTQDAGEAGIQGLTVELYENNILVGSTVTNLEGEYYFNTDNVAGGLKNSTAYEIRVSTSQGAIADKRLSTADAAADHVDSDASLVSGVATIFYTTAATDSIDHTLDIGFFTTCNLYEIALGADDGYELTTGVIGDRLVRTFGQLGGVFGAGLRFQNVAIPPGSTISSAKVAFSGNTGSGEGIGDAVALTVLISGIAVDDASTFSNADFGISSLPDGMDSVIWNLPAGAGWVAGVEDENTTTPDFTNVIQEIIDRPGWASGNDLALTLALASGTGTRRWETYEGDSLLAPKLLICFTPPCIQPSALTFSQIAPTCTSITANNNGSITLSSASDATHFGISTLNAATYDGADFSLATAISLPQTIQDSIPNAGGAYIVRIFNGANECFKDTTLTVQQVICCLDTTYLMCPGESYTMTAAAGATNIQWFKNATPISGATASTYVVTEAGTYHYTATDSSGCPGQLCCPLDFDILSPAASSLSASICNGDSYVFAGQNLTSAGTYTDTLTAANGCDSVVTLTLTLLPTYLIGTSAQICQGENYAWQGQQLTATGVYRDTLSSVNSCDSILQLSLTVLQHSATNLSASICDGDSYLFDGQNLTSAGTYTDTLSAQNGCDSVVTLTLTVLPNSTGNETYDGCQGDGYSVTVNGTVYNQANSTGTEVLPSANGCDSTVTVSLVFKPNSTGSETYSGCSGDGYSVTVNGTVYNQANPSGTEVLPSANGCDSTVTVSLIFKPNSLGSETYTGCSGDGYSVTVNGTVYNEANPTGTEVLTAANGCDSIVGVNLIFNPPSTGSEAYDGCSGDGYSVTVNGTVYNEANPTGTEVLTAANGCDSTVTVNLNFQPSLMPVIFGDTIFCSGDTGFLFVGCNEFFLFGAIGGSQEVPANASSGTGAVSGSFNDQTSAFDLQVVFSGLSGTVTAAHIHNAPSGTSGGVEIDLVANSFPTGGTAGSYSYSFTLTPAQRSALLAGNLYVNIHTTAFGGGEIRGQITAACTYTGIEWSTGEATNPIAVSSAGTYSVTVMDAGGCTGSDNVTVVVNPNSTGSESYSGCQGDGYSVTVNGTVYNEANPSGTEVLPSANGCDSTVTVSLVFKPNPATSLSASICDGDSYLFDGQNLTSAGTYSDTLTAANGCDSIVTLTLAVVPPVVENLSAQICEGDSYFFDGQNLTQAGNYADTLTAASGCDSIVNLALTVVSEVQTNLNETICDGDSYFFDNQNLTSAGVYLDTLSSAGGCDSIVTLNLAVQTAQEIVLQDSICIGETYQFNGQTLFAAGVYFDTLNYASGCDSIRYTLILSLKNNCLSIGNLVFADLDNDGIFNNNDDGIEGVEVVLYHSDDDTKGNGDDTPLDSMLTDVDGGYLFDSLASGYYFVKLNGTGIPAGYVSSTGDGVNDTDGAGAYENAPQDDLNNEDDGTQMAAMVMSPLYELTQGNEPTDDGDSDANTNLSVDFGLYEPQPLLSLGDLVFEDADNNGIFNVGDTGISGVEVQAWELGPDGEKGTPDDVLAGTDTTDNNGIYLVENLGEGLYFVKLTGVGIPAGYVSSTGEGVTDMDGAGPYEPYSGTDGDANFSDDGSQMGVMVMSDTVRLTLNGEPTSEDGNPNTNLTVDFGLYLPQAAPPSALGNFVWFDLDGDGQQGMTENGVPGVEVELWSPGGDGVKGGGDDVLLALDTTDANGWYTFENLTAGDYFVMFDLLTLPAAYSPTSQDSGADISDSDANAMGMTEIVSLEPGETNYSIDFGIVPNPLASIGDFVWFDTDHDGQQDGGEGGVPGVTVQLFDLGNDGVKGGGDDNLLASDTTDANGNYGFDNLQPGDYYVMFDLGTLPANYSPTQQNQGSDASDSDANEMGMTDIVMLEASENDPTIDFGIEPELASLGDYVWFDEDGDGQQDLTETGVPDVEVQFWSPGLNGVKGDGDDEFLAATTTDSVGYYLFSDQEPGDYYVMFNLATLPANYSPTTENQGVDLTDSDANSMGMTELVNLSPGENDPTIDFGIVPQPANLGDFVWFDLDHDGEQDTTETGVPGVEVELWTPGLNGIKGDGDDVLLALDTTDANGNYEFGNLAPGDYFVMFDLATLPANYSPTAQDATFDDLDNDANAMGMSDIVTLGPGDDNLTLDLGIEPALASLGDYVWFDLDHDGQQDGNETGVPGVTVQLFDLGNDGVKGGGDDNLLALDTTDANGNYGFDNLQPGDYYVMFDLGTLPANYSPTAQNQGADASDSDANGMGMTDVVNLSPGENDPTIDLGIEPALASLGDYVWFDLDHDGQQDGSETGVSGVTVQLFDLGNDGVKGGGDDNLLASDTTDANGNYSFDNLEPGDYYVMFDLGTLPANYSPTQQNQGSDASDSDANSMGMTDVVTLDPGENDPTIDLGIEPALASLGDYVWYDLDHDGQQDGGETGVPGVTVQLFDLGNDGVKGGGDDNLLASDTTDANGNYSFDNLEPGDYYVMFDLGTLPANYSPTQQNQGADASDSDANGMGMTDVVNLSPGENDPTIDLGIEPALASLGDYVWYDLDHDGQQDGSETGVPGVTVQLFDLGNDGVKGGGDDNLLASDTTDASGNYGFGNLQPGDYYVMFDLGTLPANYSPTQQNQGADASDSDANGMGMTDVVNLSPGENDPTIDLGIEPSLASLGDYVWFDLDHDGQQDGSETGVPGVTVQLFDLGNDGVKGGGDDNLLASDTTDANGLYLFENLEPGDYYVMFDLGTLPAGYQITLQDASGNESTDSDANSMGMTEEAALDAGESNLDFDLGIFNPVQPIFDLALRKRLTPGQPQFFKTGDPIQFTVTVFNQGDLDAYNVQVVDYLPSGLSTSDANWTGTTGNIFTQIAFLAAGDSVDVPLTVMVSTNFNQFMELVNYAEISAADDDTDTGNTPPTDIDSQPDADPNNDNGGVPNSPTDDLITDDGTTDEDDHDPSSIIIIVPADPDGFIYCDKTGKLVTGGTISVSGPGGVTIVEDGSDGSYQFFTDGTPGTYTISYSHPNGYPISTTCPPQADTLDLTLYPEGYVIGTTTLDSTGMYLDTADCAANPWYTNIYFGLGDSLVFGNNLAVQCVFIGSLVCVDTNHNDIAEPGEPGFPGLTVHLYDCADTLNPIASTVTDSLGEYRFDGLTAGDYRLQFVMPAAYRPVAGSNVDPGGFSPCITLAWSECDTTEYLCLYACPPVSVNDTTMCFGDTAQMLASVPWGSGSFGWSPGTDLSDSTIANPLAFPTVSTNYVVSYDDGLGCNQAVDTASVVILNTTPYLVNSPFIIATVECDEPRPFDAPVFADSCDNSLTITLDSTIGNMACDLVITRTWTATNDQGNSASFMQTVVVIDTTAPVIVASHPIFGALTNGDTLYADCSQIASFDSMVVNATDNCAPVTVDFDEVVTNGDCAMDGYVQIMNCGWTATDTCGNIDSLYFTVIVTDTTPPTLTASHPFFGAILDGDTLYADCSQIASLDSLGFSSFDNCGVPTVTFWENTTFGDCDVDGYLQLRYCGWTSTDSCGNTDSLFFHVIISDTTAPVLSPAPADLTVACDEDVPVPAVLTATDNCDTTLLVLFTQDTLGNSDSCFWQIERTWEVSDDCGNTDTETQIITVSDTIPPTLAGVPADTTVECDDALPFPATVTAGDNCAGVVLDFVQDTLGNPTDCNWQVRRTWTATDACGNSVSDFQIIQRTDLTPPVLAGVPADSAVMCGSTVPPVPTVTATDNCDALVAIGYSADTTYSACGYEIVRTWIGEDNCGNRDTMSQVIMVGFDTIPPTILGVPADMAAECDQIPGLPPVSATDNCAGTVTLSFNQTQTAGCPYIITRTWTATDACGNSSSDSYDITVTDSQDPVIVPTHPALLGLSNGDTLTVECNQVPSVDSTSATISDNCCATTTVDWQELVTAGDCNTLGYIQIMRCGWVATDCCGNVDSFFFYVVVIDTTPPQLFTVPADLTVECDDVIPAAPAVFGVDNCDNDVPVSFTQDTIFAACGYQIVRTWTASDDCGNSVSDEQIITVTDTTAPVITGVPADLTAQCSYNPGVVSPISVSDNCTANPALIFISDTTYQACGYVVVNTWTATDDCGNASSETQTITVTDTVPPTFNPACQLVFDFYTSNGNVCPAAASISLVVGQEFDQNFGWTVGGVSIPPLAGCVFDDCSDPDDLVIRVASIQITGDSCARTFTVRFDILDECGNVSLSQFVCVANFYDDTAPNFTTSAPDATVSCDAIPAPAAMAATDDCDPSVTIIFSETQLGSGCPYTILRTWTASDTCGNVSIYTQTLTVTDTIAPNIYNVPANTTADCDSLPPVPGNVTAGDNCDLTPSLSFSEMQIDSGCSYQIIRTWTATDNCGNTSSANQIIDVFDNEPPTLTGIVLEDTIGCNDPLPPIFYVASDNCDTSVTVNIFILTNHDDPCDLVINRIYQAADDCGNQYSVHQHIHVLDDEAPEIIVTHPDLLGANHGDTLTFECDDVPILDDSDAYAIDSCSGVDTIYRTEFIFQKDCTTDGYLLLMQCGWEAIDSCGNLAEWFVFFKVVDTKAPVLAAAPADITVDCNSIPPAAILSATDVCDDSVDVTVNDFAFGTGCPYIIIRTWTATDDCGNSASDSQIITVSDTVAPVLVGLPAATMTAECGSVPAAPVVTATDNCDTSLAVIFDENQLSSGSCPDTIIRTWVVYDDCGNAAFFSQTIFVDDTTPPVFDAPLPQNMTVQCDNVPIPAVLTATDVCDANVSVVRSDSVGTGCPYLIFRTWTATDDCGNETTYTQIVTVADTVAPTVAEPADLTASCGNVPAPVTPAASDNCDFSLSVQYFELVDSLACGLEIKRVWEFRDDCGNSTTVDQILTVTDTTAPSLVFTHPLLAGLGDGDTVVIECHEAVVFDESAAAAIDSCSDATVSFYENGITPGYCVTDGFIVIMHCTWTVTDACGNETSATLHIRIEDNTPPVISGLPADTTILCNEVVPPCTTPTVSDGCGNATMLSSSTDSIPTANGYDLICSWLAMDDCGNVAIDSQIIHVETAAAPFFGSAPGDTVIYLAQGQSVPTFGIVVAIDACTLDTLPVQIREEIFVDSNGCDTLIVRTWFVDINGDTVSVSQTITVVFGGFDITITTAPDTCGFGVGSALLMPDTLSYAWSDGGFGDMRNDLQSGTYTVIATNDNGCADTMTGFIGEVCPCLPAVLDSITTTGASCGVSDGSATLHLAGDEANYEYLWIPNLGTPNGDGDGRTGLPAGNYIVFVTWLGQDTCVEKYTVNVFDNCPKCAPVFQQETLALESPNAPEGVCLPVPLGISQSSQIYVDGALFTGSMTACDYDEAVVYDYSQITGGGQTGLYDVSWQHDGTVLHTLVNNVDELAAAMNAVSPAGNWMNNAAAKKLVSMNTGGNYGKMSVTHVPSGEFWLISKTTTTSAMGTRLTLDAGEHVLVFSQNSFCNDTLLLTVTLAPQHPGDIVSEDLLVVAKNCDYEDLGICIEIPYAELSKYGIEVNGAGYQGQIGSCDYLDAWFYTFANLPGSGGNGSFELKNWSVNGQVFTGSFQNIAELIGLMNAWDTHGSWSLDAATFSIKGGSPGSQYGSLKIFESATGTLTTLELNSSITPGSTSMLLTEGINTIVLTDQAAGVRDTIKAIAACVSPDYLKVVVKVGQSDTLELAGDELYAAVASLTNAAPTGADEAAELSLVASKRMAHFTGRKVGETQATLVLCDQYGICDTTFLTIEVRENFATQLVADTLHTIVNQAVTADLLANDRFADEVSSVKIMQSPKHGTLQLQADNSVTYTPDEDYCNLENGNPLDHFYYEVCTADGNCYVMIAYVEVGCEEVVIHNGFSPNGDDVNDYFKIDGLQKFPNHKLTIFNRWGNLVFKTKDYQNDWGGSWNSNNLPDGTYFYLLEDGEGREYKGYLQVRR